VAYISPSHITTYGEETDWYIVACPPERAVGSKLDSKGTFYEMFKIAVMLKDRNPTVNYHVNRKGCLGVSV
jgi:hypothetical protein